MIHHLTKHPVAVVTSIAKKQILWHVMKYLSFITHCLTNWSHNIIIYYYIAEKKVHEVNNLVYKWTCFRNISSEK